MNILMKRYYKLIIVFAVIIIFGFVFGSTRIISYNFWKYETELNSGGYNYTNSKNILNDWIFHEISIDISDKKYNYILESYKNNKEKEFVKVDIVIDWKEVKNVWLRLKWNIDLLEILSWTDDEFIKPALLIKFDKYEEWQTYQWLSELALRVDNNDSLVWQLISFKIFKELGLLAPSAWYTTLTFWNKWTYVYMVTEVVNDDYVEENFDDSQWVLYKALNSLSFSYLWEDPTLYVDLFEQKTAVNNYDLKLLINVLSFVSNSSDEKFEENFENYIDIDSYVGMLVMDEILWRKDMLLWLLNNYYIYIDTETNVASFVTRDQKMSFGNTNTPLYDILLKYYSKWDLENLDDLESLIRFTRTWVKMENIEKWNSNLYENDLKRRFLENKKFRALYEKKLKEFKKQIYDYDLANESLDYYKNVFLNYLEHSDFIDDDTYNRLILDIKMYIENLSYYLEEIVLKR